MMTFKTLSEYFQRLESTASRNSMVEILGELFSEATEEEIDKIVYLTQGRVAPMFEPVEFGMADKMVVKAIAKAFSESGEKVTELYKKSGDLGEVAQQLSRSEGGKLTVDEVFQKLEEIASAGGEGSVEKKVGLLSEIFKSVEGLSARFIARIPVDKMRLGFSDMTVLEGLSWMIDGTKKHKTKMEAAYNIRPDLGEIAKKVKKRGILGVGEIGPKLGTPILVMRAERLTSTGEILEKMGGTAAVEPKLDGLRTQLHFGGDKSVELFSRGLENVTKMYPDLVKAAKGELKGQEVILDGEAIGYDPKSGRYLMFQETVQRKRKYDVEAFSENVPLKLIVFDCLFLNGESLIDKPYSQRRKIVEKVLGKGNKLVAAEMKLISDAGKINSYFEEQVRKGLEGIVAKKLDGGYQAGARGWNWIKFKKSYASKLADTVDAVVMGYDYGQGARNKFGVGSFLVGVWDKATDSFKTLSKIGTGLTDEEWRALVESSKELIVPEKPKNYDVGKLMTCDVWVKPKLVGEFKADELTKSPMHTAGYALRFPRLERWREKNPEDTTSLKEIKEMVELQGKRED